MLCTAPFKVNGHLKPVVVVVDKAIHFLRWQNCPFFQAKWLFPIIFWVSSWHLTFEVSSEWLIDVKVRRVRWPLSNLHLNFSEASNRLTWLCVSDYCHASRPKHCPMCSYKADESTFLQYFSLINVFIVPLILTKSTVFL